MTGNGPRLSPDDREREADREDEAARTAGTWASQQAYKLGAEQERARLHDPQAGYGLGHDVGFSADMQHRAYVHEVMRGFEEGSQARHELYERLREQDRPQPRQQAQTQPERELEAG